MQTPRAFGRRDGSQPVSAALPPRLDPPASAPRSGFSRFAILKAAFAGIGVLRKAPLVVLAWIAVCGGIDMVHLLATFVIANGSMERFNAIDDWSPLTDITGSDLSGPARFVMPALYLAKITIISVLLNRIIVPTDREDGAWRGLGRDAMNQLGVMVLLYGAAVAVASGLNLLEKAVGSEPSNGLSLILSDAITFFVLVKLSLASPSAFRTGHLVLSESWRLTARRFWPIVITWLIALLISVAFILLMTMLHYRLDDLFGGTPVTKGVNLAASPKALISSGQVVWNLFEAPSDAIAWVMIMAPLPAIFVTLKSQAGAENSPSISAKAMSPQALLVRRIGVALMVIGWGGLLLAYSIFKVPARWDVTVSNGLGWTGACGLMLFRIARVLGFWQARRSSV